jgi:hypothetical protein
MTFSMMSRLSRDVAKSMGVFREFGPRGGDLDLLPLQAALVRHRRLLILLTVGARLVYLEADRRAA